MATTASMDKLFLHIELAMQHARGLQHKHLIYLLSMAVVEAAEISAA
ncbi:MULTISPECIES: hypothetical protein [Rhodopseudomonas]|nr:MULTISPECIES: hypothetical protein [Rhodopseudomonas]MDF3813986.1 hypothetical protein [Rhodopseudomonas sp. BAL398]WOK19946.1 hypothetical protein RBJ75_10705 [Rhodopseudomonas sp. BAL398]